MQHPYVFVPGVRWDALELLHHTWGFPKMRGTSFGVPILRTMVFWGLSWGLPVLGNYHSSHAIPSALLCRVPDFSKGHASQQEINFSVYRRCRYRGKLNALFFLRHLWLQIGFRNPSALPVPTYVQKNRNSVVYRAHLFLEIPILALSPKS